MAKSAVKTLSKDIVSRAIIDSFIKLNPRIMVKNPVMFVVEIGFVITLLLTFAPNLFGGHYGPSQRVFNLIVCITLL